MKLNHCLFALLLCCVGTGYSQSYNNNFKQGDDLWIGAYSGYPSNAESVYELNVSWSGLPPTDIGNSQRGLIFSGKNYSGSLFLYAYKKITNLQPNTLYKIIFNSLVATNYYPSDGEKIYFKAGAVNRVPIPIERRLMENNFDKGDFGRDGKHMISLGEIQTPAPSLAYKNVQLHNYTDPFFAMTNRRGELWIIVGVEPSEDLRILPDVYLSTIRVIFQETVEKVGSNSRATRMSIEYKPDQQSLYFQSDFDNDIEQLCVYTAEGHLVKVINFTNQFIDHTIRTADLNRGSYRLVFVLRGGEKIWREIDVE